MLYYFRIYFIHLDIYFKAFFVGSGVDLSRHHEVEVSPVTTNNAAASVMVPVTRDGSHSGHSDQVTRASGHSAAASVLVPVTSSVTLHLPVTSGHIPATITSGQVPVSHASGHSDLVAGASGHSGHSGHIVLVPVSSGQSGDNSHSGLVTRASGQVPVSHASDHVASVIDPVTPERNENLRETLNGFSPLNGNE